MTHDECSTKGCCDTSPLDQLAQAILDGRVKLEPAYYESLGVTSRGAWKIVIEKELK